MQTQGMPMVSDDAIPGLDDLDPGCSCADLRQVASLAGDDEFAKALIERARKANEAGYRLAQCQAIAIIRWMGTHVADRKCYSLADMYMADATSKELVDDAINWLTFNGLATYDAETQVVTLNG